MYINESEKEKYVKFDILGYSKQAKEHKNLDNSVINAGIGMLYHEGKFVTYEVVKEAIKSFDYQKLAYSTSRGSKDFQELTIKHFIKEEILKDFHYAATITPGGTGALSLAFNKYLASDLVIPNLSWANYQDIALEFDHQTTYYEMFKDGKFNLDGLINLVKDQDKPFILLNTPAHNPTGYELTNEELNNLFTSLNALNKPCVLVLDIAYQDYANKHYQDTLKNFNGLILIAASFSKSLGLYGLRCGALICLSKNEQDIIDFEKISNFYCRTIWSNSNSLGEDIVLKVLGNKDNLEKFTNELNYYKSDLKEKHELFVNLANKEGINYYPSMNGFFVTVKLKASLEDLAKEKVYLIPVKDGYRISLSSITKEEVTHLINILKNWNN